MEVGKMDRGKNAGGGGNNLSILEQMSEKHLAGGKAWGKTGTRARAPHCSECDGKGGFWYGNGSEFSEDGVRGYRCLSCGAIKPEK
jgi:hypothetical protein